VGQVLENPSHNFLALECFTQMVRNRHAAFLQIRGNVFAEALGQQTAVGLLKGVIKTHQARFQGAQAGGQDDLVVKPGGSAVFHADVGHNQVDAAPFDLAVRNADLVEKRNSAHLEPDHIIAVVRNAHRVGFGVTDFETNLRLPNLLIGITLTRATQNKVSLAS
jgi:hypothetical protein